MSKLVPIILILAGLALGGYGYTELDESSTSLSIGEVEVSAVDEGSRTQAYLLMGLGAVSLVVGLGMSRKNA